METFRNILLHEPEPQPSAERAACTCQEQPVCFPVFHVVQQTSHLCSGSASLLSFPNSVISIYEYVDAHESIHVNSHESKTELWNVCENRNSQRKRSRSPLLPPPQKKQTPKLEKAEGKIRLFTDGFHP